jgi:hypothetical protein
MTESSLKLLYTQRDRSRGGKLGGMSQIGDGDKSVACVRVRVREAYRIAVCGHEGAPSSLSLVRPSQSTQLGQSTTYRLAMGR